MATPAGHQILDQNFSFHFNGPPLEGKTDVFKSRKKAPGLGARKALNDISNSEAPSALQASKKRTSVNEVSAGKHIHPSLEGKADVFKSQKKAPELGARKALNDISNSGVPSAHQASKKHNSINDVSARKSLGPSKTIDAGGGKANLLEFQEKGKAGGRKALSDLTNSGKPSLQKVTRKTHDKKLSTVAETCIPIAIEEEGFLHNHKECTKAHRKVVDMDYFLKAVGLEIDHKSSALSIKPKPGTALKQHIEMGEMPEPFIEDEDPQCWDPTELPGCSSPACGSPTFPKLPFSNWRDDISMDFTLNATPKLSKF